MHRSVQVVKLSHMVRPKSHGLRSHLAVHNIGSTLIPHLVLGETFQARAAEGLQKAASRVRVLFHQLSDTLLTVYNEVGSR